MLEWILRGLARGIVTTRYPGAPEPSVDGLRSAVEVSAGPADAPAGLERLCPTGAIRVTGGRVAVDRGRCVLCGICVREAPERFAFSSPAETAVRRRSALVAGDGPPGLEELRPALAERTAALRRSVHIRHVDTGSDGSEEWEIHALQSPYYDVHRLGVFFTLAPRHADILLVTGGVSAPMREPLLRAWEAMPEPRAVVAAGSEACSGALGGGEGVGAVLPVDVYIPGSPPTPIMLLHGILLAVGVLSEAERAA
jgi:Ni,Fe-hydrogenase III small subunit/ferredoxin